MVLKMKSKTGLKPSKRQSVYFSCHSDDFNKYFKKISEDILSRRNCAIFYYDPQENPELTERKNNLAGMGMFVFVVTKKFLTEPNDAFETDFLYAQKSNLPIIPFMAEEGLEELFSSKCGAFQFLYINHPQYDKKISNILDKIFLPSKLEKRISEVFDAQIFLSYRKKDRESAEKLMKTIHATEKTKSIAIWYDEFLIPGENFDDSILNHINDAKIFVMNVTPGLIEKDNYVHSIEYPYAKKHNIFILPVETVPTNREILKEKFEGIGEVVSINDKEKILNIISEKLLESGVKYSGNSSERYYLLAMAYLNGVNVEVNREFGMKLMNKAVNGGSVEAIDFMIRLYKRGEMEDPDGSKMFALQKKLSEIQMKLFKTKRKLHHLYQYFGALYGMKNIYLQKKDYDNAMKMLKEIMTRADKFGNNPMAKHYSFGAKRDMITIYEEKKEYETAQKMFEELSSEIENFKGKKIDFIIKTYIKLMYDRRGHYNKREMYDEAIAVCHKAYAASKEGLNKSDELRWGAISLYYIGDCYFFKKDYDNAITYLLRAFPLLEELYGRTLNSDELCEYENVAYMIVISYYRKKDINNSLKYAFKDLELCELLYRKDSIYKKRLIWVYENLFNVFLDGKQFNVSKKIIQNMSTLNVPEENLAKMREELKIEMAQNKKTPISKAMPPSTAVQTPKSAPAQQTVDNKRKNENLFILVLKLFAYLIILLFVILWWIIKIPLEKLGVIKKQPDKTNPPNTNKKQ